MKKNLFILLLFFAVGNSFAQQKISFSMYDKNNSRVFNFKLKFIDTSLDTISPTQKDSVNFILTASCYPLQILIEENNQFYKAGKINFLYGSSQYAIGFSIDSLTDNSNCINVNYESSDNSIHELADCPNSNSLTIYILSFPHYYHCICCQQSTLVQKPIRNLLPISIQPAGFTQEIQVFPVFKAPTEFDPNIDAHLRQ